MGCDRNRLQSLSGGIAEPSQRAKMAESGRRILQFVADNDFKTALDPILFNRNSDRWPHSEAWLAAYRMTPEGGLSGVSRRYAVLSVRGLLGCNAIILEVSR